MQRKRWSWKEREINRRREIKKERQKQEAIERERMRDRQPVSWFKRFRRWNVLTTEAPNETRRFGFMRSDCGFREMKRGKKGDGSE